MTHFIDYAQNISSQTFSAASITDSKGAYIGKIVIRFTKGTYGYNHHVGAIFSPSNIDFTDTRKGNMYATPTTLVKLFNDNQVKCLDWHKELIINGGGYLSNFSDIHYLKIGNKIFTLNWVL